MYKNIINNSFNSVFEKKDALSKALLIPLVLFIVLDVLLKNSSSGFVYFVIMLVTFALSVTVAITTHRILLIDNYPVPKWGFYKFSSREWSFVFNSFLLGLIIVIPSIIFSFIPYIGIYLVLVYCLVIFSRLSLVFPSISIDEDMDFSDAWRISKDYKLLMILMVVVMPIFVSAVVGLVYGIVINYLAKVVSIHFLLLNSVLNIVITVFVISFLSATYKYLKETRPEVFNSDVDYESKVIENIEHMERDGLIKIMIPNNYDISFEQLKSELYEQYSVLGFTREVLDKENSWMIKNPELENSYISLSVLDDIYKVEVFNSSKPELSVLNECI